MSKQDVDSFHESVIPSLWVSQLLHVFVPSSPVIPSHVLNLLDKQKVTTSLFHIVPHNCLFLNENDVHHPRVKTLHQKPMTKRLTAYQMKTRSHCYLISNFSTIPATTVHTFQLQFYRHLLVGIMYGNYLSTVFPPRLSFRIL